MHVTCRPVMMSCFTREPLALVSASDDGVLYWNVLTDEEYWLTTISGADRLSISPSDTVVAMVVGKDVYILSTMANNDEPIAILRGHTADVHAAEFSSDDQTLVTVSEDRSFVVWDLENNEIAYRSSILGSASLLSVALDPIHARICIGSSDGRLWFYSLEAGYKCLGALELAPSVAKLMAEVQATSRLDDEAASESPMGTVVISRQRTGSKDLESRARQSQDMPPVPEDCTEAGNSVLALKYVVDADLAPPSTAERKARDFLAPDTTHNDLLSERLKVLVCTTHGTVVVDALTYVAQGTLPFGSEHWQGEVGCGTAVFGSASFAASSGQSLLASGLLILGSAFERHAVLAFVDVTAEPVSIAAAKQVIDTNQTKSASLSMVATKPLVPDSPLHASLAPKPKTTSTPVKRGTTRPNPALRGTKVVNAPLTFGRKVQSSGYGATTPRRKMFQPQTKFKKANTPKKATPTKRKELPQPYPVDCELPIALASKMNLADERQSSSASALRISPDGRFIAVTMTDKSVQLVRSNMSGKGTKSIVLKSQVLSAEWSHEDNLLVTSCANQTVQLWSPSATKSEPALEFRSRKHNYKQRPGESGNEQFKSLSRSQLYYLDKFVLAADGNELLLYKYFLDGEKASTDVKTYKNGSKYRLACHIDHPSAQSISTFAAINSYYSHLCVAAGTDRSLTVIDFNVGKCAHNIPEAHARPIQGLCLNQGSSYVRHAPESYDLFLSSGQGEGIFLWDLRTCKAVRKFSEHNNRTSRMGMDLSPCGRYVLASSDDRSAYLYDIREGESLAKLSGHSDVVTDVKCHPAKAQIITTSADGQLRLFTEEGSTI